MNDKLVLAVPKGRILDELVPLLEKAKIMPEKAFFDKGSRQLRFATNDSGIDIIRVRSFDVVTFVLYNAAALGVVGRDVLMEFDHSQIYAPLDLNIGKCRLSVAATKEIAEQEDLSRWSHIRVATKYPKLTKLFFEKKGIQAECVKLSGAMELAPILGLSKRIVDLVSTGKTLQENGLKEVETIADVSSYLVMNRTVFKTRKERMQDIIERFEEAVGG